MSQHSIDQIILCSRIHLFLGAQHDFKNKSKERGKHRFKKDQKMNQCYSVLVKKARSVRLFPAGWENIVMFSFTQWDGIPTLLFLSQQHIFNNDTRHSQQTVNNLKGRWLAISGPHAKDASGANFRRQVNRRPHTDSHLCHFQCLLSIMLSTLLPELSKTTP